MGQIQLHWRVVFRLETLQQDVACSVLHKSAASVNIFKERCDNVSATLGRRAWCLSHSCASQAELWGALCTR